MCEEGGGGVNEEPSYKGSWVLSEKCHGNVKCLSKTLPAFCWWAGSLSCELDYRELEEVSLYISAPLQPPFRQPAGIYTAHPRTGS